jgi:hypothetical protein
MKIKYLLALGLLLCFAQSMLAQGGFEQYCYITQQGIMTLVPIIHYQSFTNWYVEARYNYEGAGTYSLYAGKIFSRQGRFSYSITPLLGGVTGKLKGGSAGLNVTMDIGKVFFASQSQFTSSTVGERSSFFFSWSELAYQPSKWCYAGLALQHTRFLQTRTKSVEPGVVVGFSVGLWTIPLYVFSPMGNDRYYVVGMNLRLGSRIVETHLK